MPSKSETIASFITAAPPGQLANVVEDIKSITSDDPSLTSNLDAAFRKYNEEQFATVKLPGSSEQVLISKHNALGSDQYYDSGSNVSFTYNHTSNTASSAQSYTSSSSHNETVKSIATSLQKHVKEHYPQSSAAGVFPTSNDSSIAILIVANKYSLNNFWSGRWRAEYFLDPSSSSLKGTIRVDVHYFEDGNVRMQTTKEVDTKVIGSGGASVVKTIAMLEKKYQEDLNKGFTNLNEGVFKGLRRQLPVTRQRVEWDKVGAYRLGQDIGGGRSR